MTFVSTFLSSKYQDLLQNDFPILPLLSLLFTLLMNWRFHKWLVRLLHRCQWKRWCHMHHWHCAFCMMSVHKKLKHANTWLLSHHITHICIYIEIKKQIEFWRQRGRLIVCQEREKSSWSLWNGLSRWLSLSPAVERILHGWPAPCFNFPSKEGEQCS